MPKFKTSGSYKPRNYSREDYLYWRFLQVRQTEVSRVKVNPVSRVSSVKESGYVLGKAELELIDSYLKRLKKFPCRYNLSQRGELTSASRDPLSDIVYTNSIEELIYNLERIRDDNYQDSLENEDLSFSSLKRKLLNFLKEIIYYSNNPTSVIDPDEYSPTALSEHYLNIEIGYVQERYRQGDILEAHNYNMEMVLASDYEKNCIDFFENSDSDENSHFVASFEKKTGQNNRRLKHSEQNAGILFRIYQHPNFKHALTQIILGIIVISAVLVLLALLLKSPMLPSVISDVVKGLSSVASQAIVGTALAVGTASALTLTASLHSRFFSRGKDEGPSKLSSDPYSRDETLKVDV